MSAPGLRSFVLALALWVLGGVTSLRAADAPASDPLSAEALMGLAAGAAVQTPALLKKARAMDETTLLQALAALQGETAPVVSTPEAVQRLPEALRTLYASPAVVGVLGWLPAEQVQTLAEHDADWRARLDLGDDAAAQFEVEPLEALFNKRLPGAALAQWLVLEDSGPFGDLTLYDPRPEAMACCRVVQVSGLGHDTPTAYRSLRDCLDFQWVTATLLDRHRRARSPAP